MCVFHSLSSLVRWPTSHMGHPQFCAKPFSSSPLPFLVYVPFSTNDLYDWKKKNQNPSFLEKPIALVYLLETIFLTHLPTWNDHEQLLQAPFTTVKCNTILCEAWKLVPKANGEQTNDPQTVQHAVPFAHPICPK